MVPLRFVVGTVFVFLLTFLCASEAGVEPARQDFFYYPLRGGESLTDVSRIFRVPLQELTELNRIADPNRLPVGQTLKIPNAFALQAAALRGERDRLLEDKQRIERESAERQLAAAGLEKKVRGLDAEKAALAAEVAAAVHWQRSAKVLCVLLFGALGWALKSRTERAMLTRKLNLMAAENATLTAAKETLRNAAAQLELRYQKLYRGKGEAPRDVISDGTARLARAFNEGALGIEQQVGRLEALRDREERRREAEQKVLAWVFHPVRELRYRLKYHMP